ncbi:MAG TPA: SusC/RagA family TonB-linked outer membrane protein, partial [Nitrososphaera sp.]
KEENAALHVTGTVTDENNLPMAGVSVREKGTSVGTSTDNNGGFSITVGENAILEFSYIGFVTQEVAVKDQQVLSVKLVRSSRQLDQIVVIGYGSQRKKDVTSAISMVDTKDISSRPIVSTAEVLAGKAPGVQVFQPSGKPGSDLSVRIRGIASALGSSQPIYVIDGIITNDTKGLDPNTIESINVLKDASAAGIYGSAGATNGVVMITTKKGQRGKNKIELNTYYGVQKIVKKLDLLNGQQLANLLEDEKHNGGDPAFMVDPSLLQTNTDWQDEVYRAAPMLGVNVGFSGGSDKGTFYLGLGYLNQDGIVKMSNFERYSVKLNLEQNMNKWFTIGTHLNYNRTNSRDVPDNSRVNQGGVVLGALSTPPFVGKYNPDGTFAMNPFQAWENPLASIEGPFNKTITNNILGDVYGEVKLPFNLKFRTQFGINTSNYNYDYFLDPFRTQYGRSKAGIGQNNNGEFFRYTWENTLTYNKSFGDHNISAVVGTSAIEDKKTDGSQYGEGFATASIMTLNAASANKSIYTYKSESALNSYFGRVNYDYNGKYLLTGSLRADGSSRSGVNNRWGY